MRVVNVVYVQLWGYYVCMYVCMYVWMMLESESYRFCAHLNYKNIQGLLIDDDEGDISML